MKGKGFGPMAPVMSYRNFEDAIRYANSTSYDLDFGV